MPVGPLSPAYPSIVNYRQDSLVPHNLSNGNDTSSTIYLMALMSKNKSIKRPKSREVIESH